MAYIGELTLQNDWLDCVKAFTPHLTVSSKYRIINNSTRAIEYIQSAQAPGEDLKGRGVPLAGGGERELTPAANEGIYLRALSRSYPATVVVEET